MDPLSFLYIALGIGFLLFVIFACVTMIYLIQVLRDVAKISDSVRDTAERVNDYVVQPFAFINQAVEYLKPVIEGIARKRQEFNENVNKKVHKVAREFKKKVKES